MKTHKNLIFILSFLTINSALFAQHVFPEYADEARWTIRYCYYEFNDPPASCHSFDVSYQGDTIFCGYNYSKFTTNVYVRSDSLRAYLRKSTNCSDK